MRLGKLIAWLAKTIGKLALLLLAAVGLLFVSLWLEHNRKITLPSLTGSFPVGRVTYMWVNPAAPEPLAESPGEKQTLVAWIWYPAVAESAAPRAEYLPDTWQRAEARYSGILLTDFLTRNASRVTVHSTVGPSVSPERTTYPVIIMRAGGGALTTDYTTVAEDLASHGYIVVGLDAPYRTSFVVLADQRVVRRPASENLDNVDDDGARALAGELLPMWIADIRFALTELGGLNAADPSGRFKGRMDLDRFGVFGHSFGGAQALEFCREDSRCRAAMDVDGIPFGSVVQEGLGKPGMILLSDHSRDMSDPASLRIMSDIQSIYNRLPDGSLLVTIRGANHFSFSDQILLKSALLIGALRVAHIFGPLDGRRGLTITTDYIHTFFDVYLDGAPAAELRDISTRYPEVDVKSH